MQVSISQDREQLHLDTSLMIVNWHDQLPLLSYPLFAAHPDVVNVISTRLGGVSTEPYSSLNLALSTPDDPRLILENRSRLCDAVGVELEAVTIGQLVQGLNIAIVDERVRGKGSLDRAAALQETDGLVTNLQGSPLVVLVADCTVVSYFDPVRKVIALAHAGWRGTAGKIASKMVSVMQEEFGCNPADILVGIGPNLAKHDMQVRRDVVDIYKDSFGDQSNAFFTRQIDGSFLLDLNAALLSQLYESGIRNQHIAVAGISTARTDIFYSHRLEKGKTGRFAGLIALR